MSADLHFSEAVYGFGAGVFFLGYFLLEIPGAFIVERWSARLWMGRILITWGICTVLEGLARTSLQFYIARFCLGLAEAGFFPGVIVYLTHWFPQRDRARALSSFIFSVPISFVIGAPLSALCLTLHWSGIAGWRWLFILRGIPSVASRPHHAVLSPRSAGERLAGTARAGIGSSLNLNGRRTEAHRRTSNRYRSL